MRRRLPFRIAAAFGSLLLCSLLIGVAAALAFSPGTLTQAPLTVPATPSPRITATAPALPAALRPSDTPAASPSASPAASRPSDNPAASPRPTATAALAGASGTCSSPTPPGSEAGYGPFVPR